MPPYNMEQRAAATPGTTMMNIIASTLTTGDIDSDIHNDSSSRSQNRDRNSANNDDEDTDYNATHSLSAINGNENHSNNMEAMNFPGSFGDYPAGPGGSNAEQSSAMFFRQLQQQRQQRQQQHHRQQQQMMSMMMMSNKINGNTGNGTFIGNRQNFGDVTGMMEGNINNSNLNDNKESSSVEGGGMRVNGFMSETTSNINNPMMMGYGMMTPTTTGFSGMGMMGVGNFRQPHDNSNINSYSNSNSNDNPMMAMMNYQTNKNSNGFNNSIGQRNPNMHSMDLMSSMSSSMQKSTSEKEEEMMMMMQFKMLHARRSAAAAQRQMMQHRQLQQGQQVQNHSTFNQGMRNSTTNMNTHMPSSLVVPSSGSTTMGGMSMMTMNDNMGGLVGSNLNMPMSINRSGVDDYLLRTQHRDGLSNVIMGSSASSSSGAQERIELSSSRFQSLQKHLHGGGGVGGVGGVGGGGLGYMDLSMTPSGRMMQKGNVAGFSGFGMGTYHGEEMKVSSSDWDKLNKTRLSGGARRATATHAKKKRQRSKKKPADMPRRPLSAYNLFFSEERERILKELEESDKTEKDVEKMKDDATKKKSNDTSDTGKKTKKPQALLRPLLPSEMKRRPHRKTHGKISFRALAAMVGHRWKALSDEKKQYYQQLAKEDMVRQKAAMETYYEKQAEKLVEPEKTKERKEVKRKEPKEEQEEEDDESSSPSKKQRIDNPKGVSEVTTP